MKSQIEKILKNHKSGKTLTWEAINQILELTILKKEDIDICPICEETIIVGKICPRCTIDLCSPLTGSIKL